MLCTCDRGLGSGGGVGEGGGGATTWRNMAAAGIPSVSAPCPTTVTVRSGESRSNTACSSLSVAYKQNYGSITLHKTKARFFYSTQNKTMVLLPYTEQNHGSFTLHRTKPWFYYSTQNKTTVLLLYTKRNHGSITLHKTKPSLHYAT